jgi:hypothetical protein
MNERAASFELEFKILLERSQKAFDLFNELARSADCNIRRLREIAEEGKMISDQMQLLWNRKAEHKASAAQHRDHAPVAGQLSN